MVRDERGDSILIKEDKLALHATFRSRCAEPARSVARLARSANLRCARQQQA